MVILHLIRFVIGCGSVALVYWLCVYGVDTLGLRGCLGLYVVNVDCL